MPAFGAPTGMQNGFGANPYGAQPNFGMQAVPYGAQPVQAQPATGTFAMPPTYADARGLPTTTNGTSQLSQPDSSNPSVP